MKRHVSKGFTIIELLVVVSIIALLVGILLPAIGKARDNARVNTSKSNLRQIGIAHKTYAA
ncbi:MAG: type II secretion system protein, partial [Planctomycetota bacterium]